MSIATPASIPRFGGELVGPGHADYDRHRAVWNADAQRVEMHLVSLRPQTVVIPAASSTARFTRGEWIWTESSYKYSADQIVRMGATAGFRARDQWVDGDAKFALTLFSAL